MKNQAIFAPRISGGYFIQASATCSPANTCCNASGYSAVAIMTNPL